MYFVCIALHRIPHWCTHTHVQYNKAYRQRNSEQAQGPKRDVAKCDGRHMWWMVHNIFRFWLGLWIPSLVVSCETHTHSHFCILRWLFASLSQPIKCQFSHQVRDKIKKKVKYSKLHRKRERKDMACLVSNKLRIS